jgi:hypothetical protein
MAWYSVNDPGTRGVWAFDPDGAAHVIRSNYYNRELLRRARVVRRDHGFGMPTTTEVDVDFTGIREEVTRLSVASVGQLGADADGNPRALYEFLVKVREDGEQAGAAYVEMCRRATRESAAAIRDTVGMWENAHAAAKFVRDASAGILFVGATVLSGGAALAVGGAGAGLTFTGNTQDNLASNQSMRQAMGNAAISTSIAVVTNVLIPRGLSAAGRGITGVAAGGAPARGLTMGENVVLGLVSTQANIAGDVAKTALTADAASGPVAEAAAAQMRRQLGARAGFEVGAMVFQSWLSARGIPAVAFLRTAQARQDMANSVTGGMLSAVGDRVVQAMSQQDVQARASTTTAGALPAGLDLMLTRIQRTAEAEEYVRTVALRPA